MTNTRTVAARELAPDAWYETYNGGWIRIVSYEGPWVTYCGETSTSLQTREQDYLLTVLPATHTVRDENNLTHYTGTEAGCLRYIQKNTKIVFLHIAPVPDLRREQPSIAEHLTQDRDTPRDQNLGQVQIAASAQLLAHSWEMRELLKSMSTCFMDDNDASHYGRARALLKKMEVYA
jgi:hypothetical protein